MTAVKTNKLVNMVLIMKQVRLWRVIARVVSNKSIKIYRMTKKSKALQAKGNENVHESIK